MNEQKKITLATLKSFIRRNRANLLVKVTSHFDGQIDGVRSHPNAEFRSAESAGHVENTLGISGVWVVGGSRNSFTSYEDAQHAGIRCYNCCGTFVVAVLKPGIVCADCGTDKGVSVGPCPFAEEIHRDLTPVALCPNCGYQRAQDV